MQKNVLINVKGTQYLDDDKDVTELITTGSYYEKNNKEYILYEEVSDDSLQVTKNTLKLSEDEVELIRHGESNVNIVFKAGVNWESYYMTPVGSMKMTFCTKEVDIDRSKDTSISIMIKYAIQFDYQTVAEYLMEIDIKELARQ